ncbi:MAG: hypothetical protein JTT12_07805 [Candidatus Brockarchaeota archaeon]|nr:hypothetical protein [Candidatus Brockarchaeota archaeon]
MAPENIIRIVRTSKNGTIVENNPPPAKAHTAGDKGKLVLLAAEFITVGDKVNLVIASGESPYGDYEPTWASSYYGVPLSGPRFVVNMITWALNAQTNYNRMQTISKQKAKIIELQRNIESLQSQIRDLNDKVAKLEVEKNKQSLHESRGRNNNRTYNRDSNKTGTAKKKERLAIYLYFFISRLLA